MNNQKITIAIIITLLLALTITTYQTINLQNQIIQLQQNTNAKKIIKDYLLKNYGVSTIDELLQKKLKEYGLRYIGNPFTAALYPGQFQAENITGMHWYTYLSGSLYNRTDVLAYPEQIASYIIFGRDTDGDGVYDIVYAKNCTSGQIEFSGTDAAVVIQQAIDALPTIGGTILIKSGIYYCNDDISLKSGVRLVGESIPRWISATVYYGTRLHFATEKRIKIYGSESEPLRGIEIAYLYLSQDDKSSFAINGHYFHGLYLHDLVISGFDRGISLATGISGTTDDWSSVYIHRVRLVDNNNNMFLRRGSWIHIVGLSAGGGGQYVRLVDCREVWIERSQFACGSYLYFEAIDRTSFNIVVSKNHFEQMGSYLPIRFIGNGNSFYHIRINDNDFYDLDAGVFCISLDNVTDCLIEHNYLTGTANIEIASSCSEVKIVRNYFGQAAITDNGVNTKYKDNIGYVTENSGTASGLADGSYIVHGLAGTPTTVTLTCLNSTYDGENVLVYWDKVNTNSTHIAINIYWANGTAITDPVIAVSWNAKYQP